MARKPADEDAKRTARPKRAKSADFKVDLDRPAGSPLDFVHRRMAELDPDKPKD